MRIFNDLQAVWRRIRHHPLHRDNPWPAAGRFLRWQWHQRFRGSGLIVPFVADTRLILRPGAYSATANYYLGLSEFESMFFLLHLLRKGDLFIDVGANVGVYTLLASGVCRSRTIAVEPNPDTFHYLLDHVQLNRLEERVQAENIGLAETKGKRFFTSGHPIQNHVIADQSQTECSVQSVVSTLDELLEGRPPTLIKIDVEGYELPVLQGSAQALQHPSLKGVIIETMGLGKRYAYSDEEVHSLLVQAGFRPVAYHPRRRQLTPLPSFRKGANTIYARHTGSLAGILQEAPHFRVGG